MTDRAELLAGLPEGLLNQAGYAAGVFYLAHLPAGDLHTYKVQAYNLRHHDPACRETYHFIEARSAEHAISIVSTRRSFAFSRPHQDSPDEVVRDNAHYQVDPRWGWRGFIAERAVTEY